MKERACLVIILIVLAVGICSAAYEDQVFGARMNSFSGAFVSIADDAETVFVQPAGILNLNSPEASFSYGRLFWGLDDGSEIVSPVISLAWPLTEKAGFGVGYKSTELMGVYSESTLILGSAYRAHDRCSVGINIKSLSIKYGSDEYTSIDPVLANNSGKSNFDFDLGIFAEVLPYLNAAFSAQNLLNADMGIKDQSKLKSINRLGLAYFEEDLFKAALESVFIGSDKRFLVGVEKIFWNRVFALRFGVGWGDSEFRKATAGVGFNFEQFSIDYSLDYPLSGIENTIGTHYLTFSLKFLDARDRVRIRKKPVPEKKAKKPKKAKSPGEKKKKDKDKKEKKEEPRRKEKRAFPAGSYDKSMLPGKTLYPDLHGLDIKPEKKDISLPESGDLLKHAKPFLEDKSVLPKDLPGVGTGVETIKPVPETRPLKPAVQSVPSGVRPKPERKVRKPVQKPPLKGYKVKNGDTLPSLAEKFYGNKAEWIKIFEANKEKIEKGSLKTGQILIIP
jgi:LysM repeat protein